MADQEEARHQTADAAVDAVLTASRLLVAISARSFAEVENMLTLPQFRMLVVLDRADAMNISRLGEHLDVIPSTAMRMVDRLAAAGMVRRDASSSNRREVLVMLTPEGRRVVRRVTRRRRNELARIVQALAPAEQRKLVSALSAFTAAGGEPVVDGTDLAW
ncbi:MAG: MarR family winged helix-turn-helix transcriptional regulator [Nocardioides sp.]